MPYIKNEQRLQLGPGLDGLIRDMFVINATPGDLNYVVTRLLDAWAQPRSYTKMSAGMGVVRDVVNEYYRRVVVPYEDMKQKENGDVYK